MSAGGAWPRLRFGLLALSAPGKNPNMPRHGGQLSRHALSDPGGDLFPASAAVASLGLRGPGVCPEGSAVPASSPVFWPILALSGAWRAPFFSAIFMNTLKSKLILRPLCLALAGFVSLAAIAAEPVARNKGREAAREGGRDGRGMAQAVMAELVYPSTTQIVSQVLLGEVALARGKPDVAIAAYADLANRSHDPKVYARAVEVAGQARRPDAMLEIAQSWLEQDPTSMSARQALVSGLLVTNRLGEVAPHLAQLLKQDKEDLAENLIRLNRLFPRQADRKQVLAVVTELTEPYLAVPEAAYARAQAAAAAGEYEPALVAVRIALASRPDWEMAALLQAQILARSKSDEVTAYLAGFVAAHPGAKDVRLAYARALVSEKRYDAARVEFDILLKDFPDAPEVVYPVAALALQQGDMALAEAQLKHLLEIDFGEPNLVNFYLGQIAEAGERWGDALAAYARVGAGEHYLPARLKSAAILGKRQGAEAAIAFLKNSTVSEEADQVVLLLAEAGLLRDAGRVAEAMSLAEGGLKRFPANPDLLYDYAMLAEKADRLDIMEQSLRRLIDKDPANAQAYNALGYTLADRNVRLQEARSLIGRAVELAPEDPFILDSLGWVMYRQGELGDAVTALRKAYGIKADPEIAAHLGEVLWAAGKQEEALGVWRAAAQKYPEHEGLSTALRKHQP